MSRWYYPAILELSRMKNFDFDPAVIAVKLNISEFEVVDAINVLKKLELITLGNDDICRQHGRVSTSRHIPSEAIRRHHQEILDLASRSLTEDAMDSREFCNVTMAIDPKQLPKARKMMAKALQEIASELESGDPQEIYNLSMNLFQMKQSKKPL